MSPICPTCGSTIRPNSLTGQCSRCLLELARGGLGGESLGGEATSVDDEFLTRSQVRHFGDYELVEEIARGGMGIVYRAHQTSLNRPVAVKMILGGQLATPESVQRFRLEAEAAANLHHPNIISIYEVGEHETQHYFTMKLVEGGSLDARISDFKLRISDSRAATRDRQRAIARLMIKVADALAYAHQRGVLHRDLKPTNILLDEHDEPLLTDFGLAKLTTRDNDLTLSTTVLGSPSYMAPEQAAGRMRDVSTSADVYGLGAVLYELLTGRPPFQAESAVATLRKVLDEEPVPIRQLCPDAHPDLTTLCHKCLEKEPANRLPSARVMAEELERFLRGEPIHARPVSLRERAWRWCKRRPAVASLAVASALAVLTGLAGVLWQWRRAESSRQETQQVNQSLRRTLDHLEWRNIRTLVEQDHAGRAVAHLAERLRKDPANWQAASYAISILEQHAFAMPAGLETVSASNTSPPAISADGALLATVEPSGSVRVRDVATGREFFVLSGRPDEVVSLAFSRDGSQLIVGVKPDVVNFWDVRSGRIVGSVAAQSKPLREVTLSHDEQTLALATGNSIEIWRVADALAGGGPQVIIQHAFPVGNVRLSHDGRRALSWGARHDQLLLWDAQTGARLFVPPGGETRAAAVDATGRHVAAISGEYEATVWDTRSGSKLISIPSDGSPIVKLALLPDGQRVVLAFRSGLARVFSVATGSPTSKPMRHFYEIECLTLDEQGQRLLTGSRDHTARIWDLNTGDPLCEPMPHPAPIGNVAFAAHAGRVLTSSSRLNATSTLASAWQLRQPLAPLRFQPDGARDLNAVRLSPDGKLVVVGAWNPKQAVSIYEVATQKLLFGPAEINGDAYGIMFTPDMRRLVVATASGWLHGWSVGDWRPLWKPIQQAGPTQPATMSPDGTILATGSPDGFLRLWETETGRFLREMKFGGTVKGLRFSPEGNRIIAGSADGSATIWEVKNGAAPVRLKGHSADVLCVEFSRDGRRVLTGSYDSTVRLWDAATGRETIPPLRHLGEVSHATFSLDGRKVATAARDGTARIWDAQTGRPLVDWMRHEETVQTVEFHPDGRRLVTRDHAGFRLWDVETGEPVTLHYQYPVTGGLGVDSPTMRETFSPSGRQVFLGGSTDAAVLWAIPNPQAGAPAWFSDFLEAAVGLHVGEAGEYLPVTAERFREFRKHAAGFTADGYYEIWVRWYLGLEAERPQ